LNSYKVGYVSAADDVLVKYYFVRANTAWTAGMMCVDDRDVYVITEVIKLNDIDEPT
jgi:hypothetical protein